VVGRFSTLQSVVALVAGLSSIVGAGYSALSTLRSAPTPGVIVAAVRSAGKNRPLPRAVVDVATYEDTLVATMISADDGLARRSLAAGTYRVRVRHPGFIDAVREVHVASDRTVDVHFVLEPRGQSDRVATAERPASPRTSETPVDAAARAVDRAANRGLRLLGRFGL
jgi:hypothetical protein